MLEVQLTDDEFRQWRGSQGSNKKHPHPVLPPHPWTSFQSLLQPGGPAFGLVGQLRMKPNAKKRWSVFHSKRFEIAVNTNGTVVIKGSDPGEFLLWIRPSGEAGTNSRNKLTNDQLANLWLISVLVEVLKRIQARPDQAGGREFQLGPARLLQAALDALNFRRSVFPSDEASCGSFYKTMPNAWPF